MQGAPGTSVAVTETVRARVSSHLEAGLRHRSRCLVLGCVPWVASR